VLDFMRKTPDAGLAGCRQVGRDGELQKSIHSIHTVWGNLLCAYGIDRILKKEYKKETYYGNKPFAIGYPTGSFMLLRREALCGRDLFNESFFMYSEEPDLAMRLKLNGWLTYYVPSAEIVHVGGGSTSQNREKMFLQLHRSQLYFYRLYYSKQRALLLQLTWGLVILNTWIASFLASFVGLGRIRSDLFGRVLAAYPSMLYETWRAK